MYHREVSATGFLSPPEAAALLGIGLRHVYRLLNDNVLPKCKRRGRVFIPCREVIKRMERG
jgi:excisionase family DNA binding protein